MSRRFSGTRGDAQLPGCAPARAAIEGRIDDRGRTLGELSDDNEKRDRW
jgi:hypothetical protein